MTCTWLVHDLFMIWSWLVHDFTTCACLAYDLFMPCTWLVHELFRTFSTIFHDLFMTCSRVVQDLFMTYLWLVHILFMSCSLPFHDLFDFGTTLWLIYDLLTFIYRTCSWKPSFFWTCSQFVRNWSPLVDNLCLTCSRPVHITCSWIVHNITCSVFFHVLSMTFPD